MHSCAYGTVFAHARTRVFVSLKVGKGGAGVSQDVPTNEIEVRRRRRCRRHEEKYATGCISSSTIRRELPRGITLLGAPLGLRGSASCVPRGCFQTDMPLAEASKPSSQRNQPHHALTGTPGYNRWGPKFRTGHSFEHKRSRQCFDHKSRKTGTTCPRGGTSPASLPGTAIAAKPVKSSPRFRLRLVLGCMNPPVRLRACQGVLGVFPEA